MAENGLFGDSPQATPFLSFRLPVLLSYPLFLSFSLPAASFSPLFMPFSPPFLPFYLSLLSFSMRFLSFLLSFCASFARFCGIQSFLPNAVNPARYMAARRAERCFAEGDRALQGLHPASSTAASVDNLATMDVAAWVYCRHTRSFVQTSLFTPTSDTVLNVSNGSNVAATSGHSTDGIHCGSGGYCARNKRLMQQDPTFTCLSDTTAGVCVRVFTIVWCRLCRLFGIDWPG